MQNWHFSKQRGAAFLRLTSRRIQIHQPVLDLGCGSGHLTALLLSRGHKVLCADVSDRAEEIVSKRFGSEPGFLGFKHLQGGKSLPFKNNSIGTVFCLETVEHLITEDLNKLLQEINRVLIAGGNIVLTTPNKEILKNSFVQCTKCNSRFHSVQHIRAFDCNTLWDVLGKADFQKIVCRAAMLLPDPKVWIAAQRAKGLSNVPCPECGTQVPVPPARIQKRIASLIHELLHLVCIARKPN